MPEIGYNDGSYLTQKGNDLIAKLMASGEGLQFTRVSVGDGSIPSGSSPDSMTDLGHEVMDGMIASIANSNNGEVSIVAQVSSVGVETGFNATELGLWATDPDEGEILYTYLSLQEHPEWIRPDGDAVNKLATFTLVTIVSSVSIVTAIINPDAFATMADLANYALIGHGHEISDIAGLQESSTTTGTKSTFFPTSSAGICPAASRSARTSQPFPTSPSLTACGTRQRGSSRHDGGGSLHGGDRRLSHTAPHFRIGDALPVQAA